MFKGGPLINVFFEIDSSTFLVGLLVMKSQNFSNKYRKDRKRQEKAGKEDCLYRMGEIKKKF